MKKFLCVLSVLFLLIGCDIQPDGRDIAASAQAKMATKSQVSIPIPEVSYFQEKRTITNWAKRWDRPNIPTYVYLVSFGKILGYYVVDGKPASTKSYVMPEDEMIHTANGPAVMSAPDIDGTYGENNPGIRFFTAEGVAVEWAGEGASYLYSDAPINFGYEVPKLNTRN